MKSEAYDGQLDERSNGDFGNYEEGEEYFLGGHGRPRGRAGKGKGKVLR